MDTYLPDVFAAPAPSADGLEAPFWDGLDDGRLLIQRCDRCATWIFGPEWICYACHSFDLTWTEVAPEGVIYSWTRTHHPVHAAMADHGPFIVVIVELPQAGNVRLIGNLLGDPLAPIEIGAPVRGVFERHEGRAAGGASSGGGYGVKADAEPQSDVRGFTLLQWERV